jgi:MEMO1 family protein
MSKLTSLKIIFLASSFVMYSCVNCFASSVKEPDFSGQFYPSSKDELVRMIDQFLEKAKVAPVTDNPLILVAPHAGYGFSGQTAAFGYKSIKDKKYKTVIILGTSHHKAFNGAALYGQGAFTTSLGQLAIDEEFTGKLLGKQPDIFVDTSAFSKEHSVEVQLPFLQRVLTDFKIVPIVVGDCSLESCEKIALLLKEAIGARQDVLVVVSSDLYHGYSVKEAEQFDNFTLDLFKKIDYPGLYYALREGRAQACGGFGAVIALHLAKSYGLTDLQVLNHTNSGFVTGELSDGNWTVGYASCLVTPQKGENMLSTQQKDRLLAIARQAITTYLQTGKKMEVSESDPVLNQKRGAFVTLNQHHELRGCIGNLIGSQPLYLTVRDMAIEAAVGDPRFSPLTKQELTTVEIEISVLSEMQKIDSAENIELGKHGVLVRKGYQSGVFLPQVATETGWSKEEFLNNLCAHKAGLPADAWKDKNTQLYIFTADVFGEKEKKE